MIKDLEVEIRGLCMPKSSTNICLLRLTSDLVGCDGAKTLLEASTREI